MDRLVRYYWRCRVGKLVIFLAIAVNRTVLHSKSHRGHDRKEIESIYEIVLIFRNIRLLR